MALLKVWTVPQIVVFVILTMPSITCYNQADAASFMILTIVSSRDSLIYSIVISISDDHHGRHNVVRRDVVWDDPCDRYHNCLHVYTRHRLGKVRIDNPKVSGL